MDLSFLIPSRNEIWLARTIADLLAHCRGEFEIVVVCDGGWPDPQVLDHPRVRLILPTEDGGHVEHTAGQPFTGTATAAVIGQRAGTNLAARLARGRYVCKLDAHCALAEGFDLEMVRAGDALGHDVTQIPAMYNLHAFNWRCQGCGTETYQGPTPTLCATCARKGATGGPFDRVVYWDLRAGGVPGRPRRTEFWRLDHDLHFQYHGPRRAGEPKDAPIADVMTSVGACFVMRRDRFFELGGLDESHGSWGQFGCEVACKSWLSGGRHVVNRRTWFAHLFRTQGGDFSFPYAIRGSDQERAREHSRRTWLENRWPQQTRPLSWLIDHFWPIKGWSDPEGAERLALVRAAGARFTPARSGASKGLIYYSDCRGDAEILQAVRDQILRATPGVRIVSCTLQPLEFGRNLVLPLERGPLTMFRQILAALEAIDTDIVFLCEHDVLYAPEHFAFTPPSADAFYYNRHRYQVRASDGYTVHYKASQTSGLCAYRDLLVAHYRKRVAYVEQHGYNRNIGYEPGTNVRSRAFDPHGAEWWLSDVPNIDIRHGQNLSRSKWAVTDFRDTRNAIDFAVVDVIPGWGRPRGRFREWLADIRRGRRSEVAA